LTPVNPVQLLGELIDQSAAIVAYLREQVAALPAILTDLGTHPLVRLHQDDDERRLYTSPNLRRRRAGDCARSIAERLEKLAES
jgi:hypothetical protein